MMVKMTRPNATYEEIAEGCPTFDEFVRFASKPMTIAEDEIRKFNKQVRPKQCHLVRSYNFVNHWYYFSLFSLNQRTKSIIPLCPNRRPISHLCHYCGIQ